MLNTKPRKIKASPGASPPFYLKKTFDTRSIRWRYGLALGSFAVTIGTYLVFLYLDIKVSLTLLLSIALLTTTWYGGKGPGLLFTHLMLAATLIVMSLTPLPPDTTVGKALFAYFSGYLLMVGIVLLISGRKKVERQLRESEQRYRHLVEHNPLPMWVYDLETLRFLTVNNAAILGYGYSREEFLSMTIKDIRPPDGIPVFAKEISIHHSQIDSTDIWKHQKKDGTIIDVEIISHELIFDGRPSRLVLANDVTARKRAEAAIQLLNETLEQRVAERTFELEASNSELEATNRDLEAFSYSVSHDLRAPLRAIDGFSRIFVEDYADQLDDEAKRLLEIIRGNAQNMGQLIDDLLEFSRLGRKQIEPSIIDMNQLARDACLYIESSLLESQNLKIEQLPETNGDRALLRQVFANLISNAVKYSRTRENAEVKVGGRIEDGEHIYYIQDNGVGFDMQYANKLFGVFQRLHRQDEFEGTGVGLAIVQRIIQRHGGRVWAEGEVNRGATFYFALPGDYFDQKGLNNGLKESIDSVTLT